MLNIIQVEILKFKRTKISIGIFILTTLLAAFAIERASHITRTSELMNSFGDLYTMAFKHLTNLFIPVTLGLFITSLFFDEYKNDTLKELLIIPISRARIYFSKISVMLLLSIAIYIYTYIIMIIGAKTLGDFPDFNAQTITEAFTLFLKGGILIPLSMLPISIFAISGKSYLLPIGVTLLYIFPVIAFPATLMGLHPLASSLSIFSYSSSDAQNMIIRMVQISDSMIIPTPISCLINITVIASLSIVLSLYLFEKQTF